MEKALFGAGCFWGVEHFFREVPGVSDAVSGYAGGTAANPTYRQVCSGTTRHAEAVQVTFDPAEVSYEKLVDLFFKMHNPTRRSDPGSQYRSAIFPTTPHQAAVAKTKIAALAASGAFEKPVATTVEDRARFWPAEDRHQRYFEKHGGACHVSYGELEHR